MKGIKTFVCTLAAIATLLSAYVPVRAEYLGTLPRDVEWTLEVVNPVPTTTAVTVYYIDRRGITVIDVLTVGATPEPFVKTMPRPGRDARRIIVDVDPFPGFQVALRINSGPTLTIDRGMRLVFDAL